MTKEIFLNELRLELEKRKVPNIADILSDYREHFEHGIANSKSEQEIIQSLGPTGTLAQAHQAEGYIESLDKDKHPSQVGLIWSAIGKIIILTPFNFLMLIVPGVLVLSFLLTGWSLVAAVFSMGIASFCAVPYIQQLVGVWPWMALLFSFLGMLSLGIFMGLVMYTVTSFIGKIVVSYLRWNLKFVLEK